MMVDALRSSRSSPVLVSPGGHGAPDGFNGWLVVFTREGGVYDTQTSFFFSLPFFNDDSHGCLLNRFVWTTGRYLQPASLLESALPTVPTRTRRPILVF